MIESRYTWRVLVIALATVSVWIGLGARLAFLHLGPNEKLRDRVYSIRHREETIFVGRGRILDRGENILALDLPVKNVCVDPELVLRNQQASIIGPYLAKMLDLNLEKVMASIHRPGRRFAYIKKHVQSDKAMMIKKMQFKGVFFRDASSRNYPLGSAMCHVIGFSNLTGLGSAGVELEMDKYLKGVPGLRVSEKDGHGREIYIRRTLDIAPQEGADVYLTLDQNLQYIVEKALDKAMVDHQAKGAWAIIQKIKTGELLAVCNRPSYDLNRYGRTPSEYMKNRATSYIYEPGSTLKAVVIAAAMNEGLVTEDEIINCENGYWNFNGRPLRDYHAYDKLSVADVIKKSSNIGSAKIAIRLGEKKLEDYLKAFSFGSTTDIDLPGEERGILHARSKWSSISISRLAMGHEIGVTALQMLNAFCAIANHGFVMRPYVISHVKDASGLVIKNTSPEVLARPIADETAQRMSKLLARVTTKGGTAHRASLPGYAVAGKTGTAQKPIPGGYSDTAHMASFVGFLPSSEPQIGIIVVVDEPQPLHTGGVVAAPIFREIAEQAVRYMDIPPQDDASG